MNHRIALQHASQSPLPVKDHEIRKWVRAALENPASEAPFELTLRFVDNSEIHALNRTWRQQDKPTNVLAFPANLPEGIRLTRTLLGDIVIAPEVLKHESEEQQRDLRAHCAHIVIHGVLHLLGHDHLEETDTARMQAEEIRLLARFGFANPYEGQAS
ncbi:metal-dependent hydrolase [Legionella geestiana]|uniref:Endoribonuclease YbeY n=1 Tax=Legionella geestiana TaxID=45065 RepID=A0A0W0TPG9_9GAMM|nr:rRNA maturation RNase YbeY [Legionella geestiana]KTC97449.1 metal-dependent hydrolase [Legionella geestiana]QBS13344.1 rRNA maturation RNase YbeY [Legionella geestiana]QDQ40943.1 rRNA maturation RNase YbeY [Legionella geestiana]STX54126.1 metal-dependent hydrolase [Legionella geestiana]